MTDLAKLANDLLIVSDNQCVLIPVLLDLSTVFNTMDHHMLLQRLEYHVRIMNHLVIQRSMMESPSVLGPLL